MLRWIADRARSALSHRQPLAVLTFGEMRFLNTKIQETKETPWIRVFHFWGTGSYLSCRGEPRSNGSGLLRASQPGAAASVRPSRPENDTLYRFLLRTGLDPSSAKNAARLAGSRSGKRSIRPQKKENTMWCSLSFGIRQLPIFPGRRQPSIVGV